MENLLIPSIAKPPLTSPIKLENLHGFPPKSSPRSLLYTKTDAHLNYLCRNGRLIEAVTALDSLATYGGCKVKPGTYINLLQACIDTGYIHLGRIVHARIGLVTEVDTFVETKLVSMYAKCGYLSDAREVFDKMRDRNLYTWSAMIGACSREQRWRDVVELFVKMVGDGVLPDDFLLPKILQGCGNCSNLEIGKLIHCMVIKLGMSSYTRISNSILAVYAKCGDLSSGRKFFNSMDERDEIAWNLVILGYCQKGDNEEAHRVVDEMLKYGTKPGLVTWNILISGYNQIGQCDAAMKLMRKMEGLGIATDVFTWTTILSGLAQNGKTSEALELFREMVSVGVVPNGVTITSVLSACASSKSLSIGFEIHSFAVKLGLMGDVLVCNSLIDMYSKCGELEAAHKVFDEMEVRDVYTWNSMIAGYCQAGFCGMAYQIFAKMQDSNVKPNVITWNSMISGYMQSGQEDEAIDLFQKMEKEGKVKRDAASWNSLIAGYLHIGEINKAIGVLQRMSSVGLNSVTILSVLPACANVLAAKKVKEIHGCVLRRNFEYVLAVPNSLIDTYAKSGNLAYSEKIFERIVTKDIITWNAMIGGYVFHGCYSEALDHFDQMRKLGFKPNRGTFASIILAYSLAGLVDEGKQVFSSITNDYGIVPALEHYSAMIELYGRAGWLLEAMKFIEDMPVEPEPSIWAAMLTACKIHGNISLAAHAVELLLNLDPENSMAQRLRLQIYAFFGTSEESLKNLKFEKGGYSKTPIGQSWVEVNNMVHTFVTGDQTKLSSDILYPWLQSMPTNDDVHHRDRFYIEEDEEKEEICGFHSEKLALAFALIGSSRPAPKTVRIVKNIRMCRDCHMTAKYISRSFGCEIYLSDPKCLHHFKNGSCSCRDYW